jgi:RsiW-degrading membrane proteinase PrsW (M82 family)
MTEALQTAPTSSTVLGGRITVRALIFWAGVTFWLGNMIVHTGTYGIAELWASLSFVAELAMITSATRTIALDRVAVLYCWGGTVMGVMWLIGSAFTFFIPDPNAVSRQFFIPLMEESLKLAPVAYLVWRGRRSRAWSMSASDIMLMGAASGGGFGLVEEAYFHLHYGPTRAVDWFQLTRINGPTLTLGHSTWSALAGATLGLALLWRPRKPFNYLLAGCGILWSIIDHSHHNYGIDRTGISVDLFNFVTGHGWLSLYFFVIALIAVLVSDLNVIYRVLPPLPELKTSFAGLLSSRMGAMSAWRFILTKRALAFVSFHYKKEPPSIRGEQLEPILYRLLGRLMRLRSQSTPSVQGPLVSALNPGAGNPEISVISG